MLPPDRRSETGHVNVGLPLGSWGHTIVGAGFSYGVCWVGHFSVRILTSRTCSEKKRSLIKWSPIPQTYFLFIKGFWLHVHFKPASVVLFRNVCVLFPATCLFLVFWFMMILAELDWTICNANGYFLVLGFCLFVGWFVLCFNLLVCHFTCVSVILCFSVILLVRMFLFFVCLSFCLYVCFPLFVWFSHCFMYSHWGFGSKFFDVSTLVVWLAGWWTVCWFVGWFVCRLADRGSYRVTGW